MTTVNITTTREGQYSTDYSVRLVGTAEIGKNLTEMENIDSVKTKQQVIDAAGENSMLYQMYLNYLKKDKNFDTQVAISVLPVEENSTASVVDVEFTGTSTTPIKVDFCVVDPKFALKLDFPIGTTATQIVSKIIEECKLWKQIPVAFKDFTVGDTKIEITSKVAGKLIPTVYTRIKGNGIEFTTNSTEGTGGANADELASYIETKSIKERCYVFEDGIEKNNFLAKLEKWQEFLNKDLRGCELQAKIDKYSNLTEYARGLNKHFIRLIGLKKINGTESGHITVQPCCLCSYISAVWNMCYTEGVDINSIIPEIGIGDPSNVSLPIADAVLEDFSVVDGEGWLQDEDGDEVKLLTDSGVSVFTPNKLGYMVYGNMVTTYRYDKEGKIDKYFHFAEFDECVSSFLSYLWGRLKRKMKHKRLELETKANYIIENQTAYQVASGQIPDEVYNRSFKFVDKEGQGKFMETLSKNTLEDYTNGRLVSQAIQIAVYQQLREIFQNHRYTYIK